MSNPRITAKERGLIKGALRRVFSRSDIRREVLAEGSIQHTDPTRPRVKKWSRCAECKNPAPQYQVAVDHKSPVIPVDRSMEEMTLDELVNNIWCEKNNLQILCIRCHTAKTKVEAKERRENKKGKKKANERKTS